MRPLFSIITVVLFTLIATAFVSPSGQTQQKKGPLVRIKTSYGPIKVRLYDATPKHRDNFLKLVKKDFYDSLLFHRVIQDFMVQGGDPDSKNAPKGADLGNGGPGYTIPAEIRDGLFHKKGALAAARKSDRENPERASSGSQFYIVQGKRFTRSDLKKMAAQKERQQKQQFMQMLLQQPEFKEERQQLVQAQQAKDQEKIQVISAQMDSIVQQRHGEEIDYQFSDAQIEAYSTVGGAPHLDGAYTVFGEVVEGLSVVDSIAAVETNARNRPLEDIIMTIEVIEE